MKPIKDLDEAETGTDDDDDWVMVLGETEKARITAAPLYALPSLKIRFAAISGEQSSSPHL